MNAQDWIDRVCEGLRLMFVDAPDHATTIRAIEAFLEVVRLQVARA